MRLRHLLACSIPLSFFAACGGDELSQTDPLTAGSGGSDDDGGAGAPGTGGSSGSGGEDAGPNSSRGGPDQWPSQCAKSCEEACARLDQCGASTNAAHPLGKEECVARCETAEGGQFWDDISENFKCCAAQEDCFDVSTCGGWLKHPDTVEACDDLCRCAGATGADIQATVPPPPADAPAPKGYRYSPDTIVFEGAERHRYAFYPGASQVLSGRYEGLRFGRPIPAEHLRASAARALPTFVDATGRLAAANGRIVLKVSSAAALARARSTASTRGLTEPRSPGFGDGLYFVESSDPWASVRALPELDALPGVRAELDMIRAYTFHYTPNDPMISESWHLRNTGVEREGVVTGVDGRVTEAWDVTLGSPEVVIAINDDGVDLDHPEFAGKLLPALDYPDDWQVRRDTGGFGGHGTPVAAVAAAAADNATGGAGVCPKCRILPKLLAESGGGGSFTGLSDSKIAQGFVDLVDAGAWVINNSWGPGGSDPRFQGDSLLSGYVPPAGQVVVDAFEYAETRGRGGKGTVIVFANGNDNIFTENGYVNVPNVVGVAAVDDQGVKSYYSTSAPGTDVAAPSNGGLHGIVAASPTPPGEEPAYTRSFGGTSSASPFVAGLAGLVLSANPDLTAAEVRDILRKSATKIDRVWGKYDANGHSTYYGAGLVNAWLAVKMARGECTGPSDCTAPSDECTGGCDGTQCDACRTDADCATGHICQALPALGRTVCIAEAAGGPCPSGSTRINDYCIPSRQTCGLCGETETCNGRDDDCDGVVDGDGVCDAGSSTRCVQDGAGCPAGQICAGINCTPRCSVSSDCPDDDSTCESTKSRYGVVDTVNKGCNVGFGNRCRDGCTVLASSIPDADLQAFLDCMAQDESCGNALTCFQEKLPVSF